MEDAKQKLTELRKRIVSSTIEVSEHIEWLNPSRDAGMIIYFKKISEKIKDDFRTHQEIADMLKLEVQNPPIGSGAETGKKWHTSLKKCIDNPSTSANEIGNVVINAVKKWSMEVGNDSLDLLQSEFPLYGYMLEGEVDGDSESYLWKGKADAIGWYKDNYVIVDWKTADLLDFWKVNRQVYGDYLHQCLVYARLLMLQLNLPKLPYILIVPISNVTGKEISPGWFCDFPKECKDEIEQYAWSIKEKKTILSLPSAMFNNVDEICGDDGLLQKDKKLRDVIKDDYTVKQLILDINDDPLILDATLEQLLCDFGYDELKIV